jgi:hypothetical protein
MEWREASLEWREASYFISPLSFALSLKKADNSPQSWSGRSVSGANDGILCILLGIILGISRILGINISE